jgi:hypothetical protein
MAIRLPVIKLHWDFIRTGKQGRGLLNGFSRKAMALAGADVHSDKPALFKTNTEKNYADAGNQSSYKGFLPYADFREMLQRKRYRRSCDCYA